jgi:CHAT domain-containing protein
MRGVPAGTELVVVPEGLLGRVPFAALPLRGDRGPLVGSRYPLRYAPSLAVLQLAAARRPLAAGFARAGTLRRALVVGVSRWDPPQVRAPDGQILYLSVLRHTRDDSRWVAELLGVVPLTDSTATEVTVRQRLPRAPVVHLATHGLAYETETQARNSFVALTPGGGEDGLLTVGEVLDDPSLVLTAELVTLSACQTGLGDVKQAEGTVGLQRAFLAKGARSVLVSLWSVDDSATSVLMRSFYTHWLRDRDHPTKAEALHRAQEAVRAQFPQPRYWAAFQLVGAN